MCRYPRLRLRKAQATSAAGVRSLTKGNVAKFFHIFGPVLWLINFYPHRLFNYVETGVTVVQHKVCKISPLRVGDGSLCLQQRGVHSWQLLPAWMPPLRMFLLFWCFLGATWRLNSGWRCTRFSSGLSQGWMDPEKQLYAMVPKILSVLWSCVKKMSLSWHWMVTILIRGISRW
jgi:hypothetical protein